MGKKLEEHYVQVPNSTSELLLNAGWNATRVWLALMRFADKQGECFPSYATLQSVYGIPTQQAVSGIRDLENLGLLKRRKRYSRSTVYFISSLPDKGQSFVGQRDSSLSDKGTVLCGTKPKYPHLSSSIPVSSPNGKKYQYSSSSLRSAANAIGPLAFGLIQSSTVDDQQAAKVLGVLKAHEVFSQLDLTKSGPLETLRVKLEEWYASRNGHSEDRRWFNRCAFVWLKEMWDQTKEPYRWGAGAHLNGGAT